MLPSCNQPVFFVPSACTKYCRPFSVTQPVVITFADWGATELVSAAAVSGPTAFSEETVASLTFSVVAASDSSESVFVAVVASDVGSLSDSRASDSEVATSTTVASGDSFSTAPAAPCGRTMTAAPNSAHSARPLMSFFNLIPFPFVVIERFDELLSGTLSRYQPVTFENAT